METLRGAVSRAPALGAAAGSGGSEGVGVGEGKFRGGGCAPRGCEPGAAGRADPAAPCPVPAAVQPVGPRCRFPEERCRSLFPAAALFSLLSRAHPCSPGGRFLAGVRRCSQGDFPVRLAEALF